MSPATRRSNCSGALRQAMPEERYGQSCPSGQVVLAGSIAP
jgi:hypothetical protein